LAEILPDFKNNNLIPSQIYSTNNLGFFPKKENGTTSTYYTKPINYNKEGEIAGKGLFITAVNPTGQNITYRSMFYS
jgi:hypothetical protein